MITLFIFYETFTNGFLSLSLSIISLFALSCGIMVIISKNPIVSVLFLIGLFLNIACYLIIVGINFIGLSYLLVYVGAVSILFLFILMLINVRISELLSNTSNNIPLAVMISLVFYNIVNEILPDNSSAFTSIINLYNLNFSSFENYNYNIAYNKNYTNEVFNLYYNNSLIPFLTDNIWDGSLAETTHITNIGNIMYSSYSTWLIITSMILLLAMVGAIVITIKQKN